MENIAKLQTNIKTKYKLVNKENSVFANKVNRVETDINNQNVGVSVLGSCQVFLKLGKYPAVSINETMTTAKSGFCICHQTTTAESAKNKVTVSILVIFLVPYLSESSIIIETINAPDNRPKPEYILPP